MRPYPKGLPKWCMVHARFPMDFLPVVRRQFRRDGIRIDAAVEEMRAVEREASRLTWGGLRDRIRRAVGGDTQEGREARAALRKAVRRVASEDVVENPASAGL